MKRTFLQAIGLATVLAAALAVPAWQSASAAPVFNAKSFGARCNGTGDDYPALQRAEQAAFRAGGGTVYIPAGSCRVSSGIAMDSNVSLKGAGAHTTTLVATPDFGFGGRTVRRGENGRFIGMVWLDGPSQTGPLHNVLISDIGFDPRAGTQKYDIASKGTYNCITANILPLQHITFQNLYFNLGANAVYPSGNRTEGNGPKGFFGIELPVLGVDPDNPSYDLKFENIEGRNGNGTIQLALGGFTNSRGVTSTAHDIYINGVHDVIDTNNVADDRTVVDGVTNPAPGKLGQMYNFTIENIDVDVKDNVTTGSINGVHINPATNTIIHNVLIENIKFHGSPNGHYGAPLPSARSLNASGAPFAIHANQLNGFVRNVTIRNINAVNSGAIFLGLGAESGQVTNTVVDNVQLLNCLDYSAAIVVQVSGNSTGSDRVIIRNFHATAAPQAAAAGGHPSGLYFSALPGKGVSGNVVIQNGLLEGYTKPLVVRPGFDGMQLEGVRWTTGQAQVESRVTIH